MATENTNNSKAKIALITGGSRGLGHNTALSLARKGVDVAITYHSNQAEADATVAAIKALGRNAAALQLDTGAIEGAHDRAHGVERGLMAQRMHAVAQRHVLHVDLLCRHVSAFPWPVVPRRASQRRS